MKSDFEENKDEIIERENSEKSEKSDNLKRRKIRAWCAQCYQTFENGPLSKQCLDHYHKENCNLIECRKKILQDNKKCIRRFKNINSENRHTYCIDIEEIKNWEINIQIQNCVDNIPKDFIDKKRDNKNNTKNKDNINLKGNFYIFNIL